MKAENTAVASPAMIRANAARMIAQVIDAGRSLDALFAIQSDNAQERGLTRTLVYGTLRWHIRLHATLTQLSARPLQELQPEIRALLLLGLFQLLHTDIAVHAVVAETVEATRWLKQPRAAGLVNAVLRRCQREQAALTAQVDKDTALRTAHPAWLVDSLAADWPHRYEQILDANNVHPPMWLRVNRQRASGAEYLQRLIADGHAAEPSQYFPQAIRLLVPTDVRNLPNFSDGDVSVQDAAAQLAAPLLAAEPGMRVLDACAAPGGKACHVLELQPSAALIALDISKTRLQRVQENLARLQLQASLSVGDAEHPDSWWDGRPFDRILLDVPCSATGVIRRHPDIKLLRRATDIPALSERQSAILQRLWPLLAPGGRLVYASCSALRAENAIVVGRFLAMHSDATDMTQQALQAIAPGFDARDQPRMDDPGIAIATGDAQMDGFYYACIAKSAC